MKLIKAEETLKEKFSENTKRGRPRLFDKKYEQFARQAHGMYVPLRTVQNREYEMRAVEILDYGKGDNSPYRWLCDPEKSGIEGVSERQGYRKTILTELGRVKNETELRLIAERICELKPKTQEAVSMIRRWKLGRNPKAKISLEDAIEKAIVTYKVLHPEITYTQIHLVLLDLESKYMQEVFNSVLNKRK